MLKFNFILLKMILQLRMHALLHTIQLLKIGLIVLLSAIVLAYTINNVDSWDFFV